MRLFVALLPPGGVLRELDAAVAQFAAAAPAGLRWTARDARHVTLAFLGEVPEDRLPDLTARLARAARRHPPLDLRLAGGGRFGDHVLWAGVAGETDALSRLAASVAAGARRAGLGVEERAFRAHVTLARQRGAASLRPLAAGLAGFTGTGWRARELALVRSHPPAPGVPGARSRYETLARWELGAARADH